MNSGSVAKKIQRRFGLWHGDMSLQGTVDDADAFISGERSCPQFAPKRKGEGDFKQTLGPSRWLGMRRKPKTGYSWIIYS
jgi:hypothetical protein